MGLMGAAPTVDWAKMQAYKDDVIGQNTKGIEFLFKKNKVTWIKGWATIPAPGQIKVGDDTHTAKNIVIATGSEVATLPGVTVDEQTIVSSTGALTLNKIPKTLVVIGAGVIGLEMGSIYARLGTQVTVIEYLDAITPGMDAEVAKTFQRILVKQGLKFIMGAAVQGAQLTDTGAKVTYKLRKTDAEATIDTEVVLLATGRKPFTAGLGLDALNITMTPRGQIQTDAYYATNINGIYAIGDAIAGPMLAHKAEDEGIAVAEILSGQHGHVNYGVIPGVIYTTPEVANVGKTEEQLKAEGTAYKVGKFSFMGNGRAKLVFQGDGFVKILADASTDRILGAHIIGPMAGDLIHELCVAMEFGASAQDLAMTTHAHPTYSEAVREAALACGDGAIHA
jgi:dihydrolipoamide dehydrogenase